MLGLTCGQRIVDTWQKWPIRLALNLVPTFSPLVPIYTNGWMHSETQKHSCSQSQLSFTASRAKVAQRHLI